MVTIYTIMQGISLCVCVCVCLCVCLCKFDSGFGNLFIRMSNCFYDMHK